jgi:hypothetical protein
MSLSIDERTERWRKTLSRRLETEVSGTALEECQWIVQHLRDYVERWLGFARMNSIPVEATLSNDAFCIILAAVRLLRERQSVFKGGPQIEKFGQLQIALAWIQESPVRSELEFVERAFHELLESFVD